jgi:hypothetical protein
MIVLKNTNQSVEDKDERQLDDTMSIYETDQARYQKFVKKY